MPNPKGPSGRSMFLARNEDGPLPKLRPAAMETAARMLPRKARQRPEYSEVRERRGIGEALSLLGRIQPGIIILVVERPTYGPAHEDPNGGDSGSCGAVLKEHQMSS